MSKLQTQKENLKEINGYDGKYLINSKGEIFSLIGGKLKKRKTSISKLGYENCILFKDNKAKSYLVHRLVAFAFIKNPDELKFNQINHKDYNRLNNSVENLEWSNSNENNKHRCFNILKTSIYSNIYFHRYAKKWYASITINKKKIYIGSFINEIDAHNNLVKFKQLNKL